MAAIQIRARTRGADARDGDGEPSFPPRIQRSRKEGSDGSVRGGASSLRDGGELGMEKSFTRPGYDLPSHKLWSNRQSMELIKHTPFQRSTQMGTASPLPGFTFFVPVHSSAHATFPSSLCCLNPVVLPPSSLFRALRRESAFFAGRTLPGEPQSRACRSPLSGVVAPP